MVDDFPEGAWHLYNHQTLAQLLSASFPVPPAAVFDWDNTCIFNDIGDACFRYQLEHFAFASPPQAVAQILRMPCALAPKLASGTPSEAFVHDILIAYATLWEQSRTASRSHQALDIGAHQDLRAKLGAFYEDMLNTPALGAQFAYPWVLQWFSDFSQLQLVSLVEKVIAQLSAESIGRNVWHSHSAGLSGHKHYAYTTHLAPILEMQQLFAALNASGIQVWVVSASLEPIVQAAATILQYPIDTHQIIGMQLQQDAAGKLQAQMRSGHPITYRMGKVEAIQKYIQAPVVLVAGDALTDLEMLLHQPEATRLIIHRDRPEPEMQRLYAAAEAFPKAHPEPHFQGAILLQGRDQARGCFLPKMHSSP